MAIEASGLTYPDASPQSLSRRMMTGRGCAVAPAQGTVAGFNEHRICDVAATQATQFLKANGIAFDLLEYDHDPRAEAYGLEAVEKLGLIAETVFKTLVVTDEAAPAHHALALVPAAEKLSLPAAARALGWKRAAMAKPADAQRLTGYVVGGISAFGTKRPLPVLVDASLLDHPLVHLSGGRRGLEIRLGSGDLVACLKAIVAPVTT